jgi:YfiH family protein
VGAAEAGGWRYEAAGGIGLYRAVGLGAAGALAAVSSRCGGVSRPPWDSLNLGGGLGDAEAAVAENRRRLGTALGVAWPELARVRQVHGTDVHVVRGGGPQGRDADALIGRGPGAALAILVADCAPVFVLDPRQGAVGLAHAGWRGTAGGIAARTVAAMAAAYGSRPRDLLAAVGPAIGPCCYEVDEPVLARLRAAAPWWREVVRPGRPGHAFLDVAGANARFLREAGVPPERVAVAGVCTACGQDRLFSHRASGGRTGRMAAVLALPR